MYTGGMSCLIQGYINTTIDTAYLFAGARCHGLLNKMCSHLWKSLIFIASERRGDVCMGKTLDIVDAISEGYSILDGVECARAIKR